MIDRNSEVGPMAYRKIRATPPEERNRKGGIARSTRGKQRDVVRLEGYRVTSEEAPKGSNPPAVEATRQVYCEPCDAWWDYDFSPHPDHEAPA